MVKYKIEMTVEVDPTVVQVWPGDGEGNDGGIYCEYTGDTYKDMEEFFDHQIGRVIQSMRLVEISKVTVKD